MSGRAGLWPVRLADIAAQDFRDIYARTAVKFGGTQAEIYANALSLTIEALQAGPLTAGVRRRENIAEGLWSLPVKVNRKRGRHFVYFRVAARPREIVVLRILHDAMDPTRHLTN